MVNGPKTKFGINHELIAIQSPLWLFSSPWLSLLAARVSLPFHIHAKGNFGKKKNVIRS